MRSFNFHSPETISEVLELLAQYGDEAKVMGGGTALTTMMKQSLVQPAHVVSCLLYTSPSTRDRG